MQCAFSQKNRVHVRRPIDATIFLAVRGSVGLEDIDLQQKG